MIRDEPQPLLLRKCDYAKHRGVSGSMVTHWVKSGRLVLVDDRVDVVASDASLAASLDPARGGKGGAPSRVPKVQPAAAVELPTATFTTHRAVRESFAAKNEELDYRQRLGELVERAAYDRALADGLAPVLTALDALATQYGPQLAAETDVRRVQNILDDAVEKIRQDMADAIRSMIAVGAATRQ